MKSIFIFLLILFQLIIVAIAQVPQKMNYQAVARDENGKCLANEDIDLRITILQDSINGIFVYQEIHSTTTTPNGHFHIQIGNGTPQLIGNITPLMNSINWGSGDFWMKVELKSSLDPTFMEVGVNQFLSVPYALYGPDGDIDSNNEVQNLSYNNDTLSISQGNSVYLPRMPIGTVISFAGQNVPEGWLACDGTLYSISDPQYSQLFSVLGYSWGGTGGNFRVPDLRGQFLRGWSNGSGEDPDAGARTAKYAGGVTADSVGSFQNDAFRSHLHGLEIRHVGLPSSSNLVTYTLQPTGGFSQDNTKLNGGAESRGKNAYVFFYN